MKKYLVISLLAALFSCEGEVYIKDNDSTVKGVAYIENTTEEIQKLPAKDATISLIDDSPLYSVKTNANGEFSFDFLPKNIKTHDIKLSGKYKDDKGVSYSKSLTLEELKTPEAFTLSPDYNNAYKNSIKVIVAKNNTRFHDVNVYLFINKEYADNVYNNSTKAKPSGFIKVQKTNLSGVAVFTNLPFPNSKNQVFYLLAKDTVANLPLRSQLAKLDTTLGFAIKTIPLAL